MFWQDDIQVITRIHTDLMKFWYIKSSLTDPPIGIKQPNIPYNENISS